MLAPLVMLVDDEAPFVETMAKRLEKRELINIWTCTANLSIRLTKKEN